MSKPRISLQNSFGFPDADLGRPSHDQIMLWLSKIAPTMLATWLGPMGNLSKSKIDVMHQKLQKNRSERIASVKQEIERVKCNEQYRNDYSNKIARLSSILQELETLDITPPVSMPAPKIEGTPIWEHPITNSGYGGKSFVIGFVDLLVRYQRPYLDLDPGSLHGQIFYDWIRSEEPLIKPSYICWKSGNAYFEVKTEIPSLGELLRQIQLYRTYFHGDWFVVSPDTRYIETLAEQNVGFIEYKPEMAPTQS